MTGPNVLVVDDNRDMADGIGMLLGELPLTVNVAYSASDALARLESSEFALVLSDIRMPYMDGVELLSEIKQRWPRTRVVLLTAFGSIDSAVEAMKEGASDYLTKPFDNAALIDVVQRNLSAALSADEFDIPAVVAAVAAHLSPDDLFNSLTNALETLRSAAGADDCELFLSEPDGKDVLLSVWVGTDGEALVERTRFEPGAGYPGIVTATGESFFKQGDLADDPRYLRRRVLDSGIKSYACSPLKEPRGSFGSIHLLSRREDFPADRAVALLEQAAVPLASAVRAGLASLRQSVDEACAPHESGSSAQLRALLECVRRSADATYGSIALVDPNTGLPARVVSTGPATLLCAHAEAGAWAECPSVLDGHGFAPDPGRRAWPVPCRRGVPRRVVSPCCLPLMENGRFHGLLTLDLGRKGESNAAAGLVPLLVMSQQAAIHLASTHPGLKLNPASDEVVVTSAPPPDLEIRCLGPFELLQRGTPIPAEQFPRSKALGLLKLLALKAGTPLSKDFLIEHLWPDADPQSGANRLHGVVHALRSVIEPHRAERTWLYVRNRGELYYLDIEAPLDIDLLRYRSLLNRGLRAVHDFAPQSIEALEQAVALYRGELFEDEPYAEWCELDRRELAEQQVTALERLAAVLATQGEAERSLELMRRAVRLAPYREDLLVSLLDTLVHMGRPGEARAQYDEFRKILERELGAEPSRALEDFRRKVFRPTSRPPAMVR
jgi:two-component SAPR family response regulator